MKGKSKACRVSSSMKQMVLFPKGIPEGPKEEETVDVPVQISMVHRCNTCIHGCIMKFEYGRPPDYGCKLNPSVRGDYNMLAPDGCRRYVHKTLKNQGLDYGFIKLHKS